MSLQHVLPLMNIALIYVKTNVGSHVASFLQQHVNVCPTTVRQSPWRRFLTWQEAVDIRTSENAAGIMHPSHAFLAYNIDDSLGGF